MKLLILYWSFMAGAYIAASKLRSKSEKFSFVSPAMMITIYVMVLIMGLRMGTNKQITDNLGTIGIQSLVITIITIAGSMVAIFAVRKVLKIDRYGRLERSKEEEDGGLAEPEEDKLDLKSTIIILALVVLGMVAGHLAAVVMTGSALEQFDQYSNISLVVLLTVLLTLVGFDLGLSGTVAANLKSVGFKAFAFPFAAVLGTLLLGTICCFFFGFTIKEGIAICAGFGWYTYAPNVIAAAGTQYTIASAVSFMHNVIRETAGLVFIPLIAKKIGYLEATGVPGVAAMDVCMPIVERSCRPDTVVYSFAIGFLMCIVTSTLVPVVMGI
ncbi:MAG: lysine exporter LysO family protein [Clostridiales bacterium]|nr:lysine exporter LysO family protein [Clostridiales bacterium]